MTSSPPDEATLRGLAERLTGQPIQSVTRIPRGGNNRLMRVVSTDGRAFALKWYPRLAGDDRDRLGTEFGALRFLAACGEKAVPAAIAAAPDSDCALYEWIEGQPPEPVGEGDIIAAVEFLARLALGRTMPGAAAVAPASEACLSPAELARQLDRRHQRLAATPAPAIAAWLATDYRRLADRFLARAAALDWQSELSPALRVLSPSDFGFHNALRRPQGGLCWLDMEYFGWDDPVKGAADFLLHPGMTLSQGQRALFLARISALYPEDDGFAERLRRLYPLYGLRWSLILLNEFLPERWARRALAGGGEPTQRQAAQLAKAQDLLARLDATDGALPHG